MAYEIADELLLKPEEKTSFDFRMSRCGIGNAISKEMMVAINPLLNSLEFRVTDDGNGFVSVWVNHSVYDVHIAQKQHASDKKDMKKAISALPRLVMVLVVASLAISAAVAWKIAVLAFLFPGLAAVGFGTAFVYGLITCMGVSALITVGPLVSPVL
ncbi:MAG: hypothetical protein UW58_C0044G0003 [Candidatus Collierbacteria bacterium GW2011_GWC2_44_30]|nr:MAG: hypothetical protein UW58_C0044G0003 [Candidatus Collierbacteria bacterium GW2011_GWC2_44_30]